jgi:hypothetical protein
MVLKNSDFLTRSHGARNDVILYTDTIAGNVSVAG